MVIQWKGYNVAIFQSPLPCLLLFNGICALLYLHFQYRDIISGSLIAGKMLNAWHLSERWYFSSIKSLCLSSISSDKIIVNVMHNQQ